MAKKPNIIKLARVAYETGKVAENTVETNQRLLDKMEIAMNRNETFFTQTMEKAEEIGEEIISLLETNNLDIPMPNDMMPIIEDENNDADMREKVATLYVQAMDITLILYKTIMSDQEFAALIPVEYQTKAISNAFKKMGAPLLAKTTAYNIKPAPRKKTDPDAALMKLVSIANLFRDAVTTKAESDEEFASSTQEVWEETVMSDTKDLEALDENLDNLLFDVSADNRTRLLNAVMTDDGIKDLRRKLAPNIITLADIFAGLISGTYSDEEAASFLPKAGRTKKVAAGFEKMGAKNLARISAWKPQ